MTIRLLSAMMLLVVPLQAEWMRQGYCAKGRWSDVATPHALSYFTDDPLLRDDGQDFCIACTAEEKATLHLNIKAKTVVRPIGTIARMNVFDVFYYFSGEETPRWKFVLVKTGPDQYREIIHVQRTTIEQVIGPTTIVKAGLESILSARAPVGVRNITYGDYFWLGEDGPILVNVDEPAKAAGIAGVPPGKGIYGLVVIDFPTMTATLPLVDLSMAICCTADRIEVKFKLQRGKVTITSARYLALVYRPDGSIGPRSQ